MAKHIPENQILELIERFEQGASLEEILLGLDPSMPRRTLQRRLAELLKQGRIAATGAARSRKYRIVFQEEKVQPISSPIPLSKEAKIVLAQVSQPLQARHPVPYRREFLEAYTPNRTNYLPETLRQKLHQIGKVDGKVPAGTYARQIFQRLLIDLSWNSSRLEGNTYSLLETERLLANGKAAEGKNLRETQMILNHKAAIEFLIHSAEEIGINRYTLLNLHALLSDNLIPDPAACGRLRHIPVGIAKSVYHPLDIPQQIEECFDLLIAKANAIEDPFEQAFFLMVQLPYLQPFDDVNKRTSRLAANIPLIRKNLSPLSFIDVPEELYIDGLLAIYELNRIDLLRDVFAWAYERSSAVYSMTRQSLGEPDPFRWKYRDAIRDAIREVVTSTMRKTQAVATIRRHASRNIATEDQARFIEIVERDLQNLHEGNLARYQLRIKEFENWKKSWD